ncbi:UNVERIFIED_CONTAM: hypothetical protein GTU68_058503 [Idotea baltica]|nr:hypothetical protein [Idotea baltica]
MDKVAIIGECMLELSHSNKAEMRLSYGGDTLNTAVYLSRLGVEVDYVTALGDDNMSDWMLDQWRAEGVGCDLVERSLGSVPGLYMIQTDEHGERSFLYWRDSAPAKRMFDDEGRARQLFDMIANYQWVYLSGITLALYNHESLQRFIGLLLEFRNTGGKIVFDGNYRPRLWPSESAAQKAFEAVYRLSAVALPTLDDEFLLFGDKDREAVVQRLRSWGITEIGLKMGAEGCLVVARHTEEIVKSRKVAVLDTTSAGDSFNAGYMAAKIKGSSPQQAAEHGHNLASVVIQHRGAIIPIEKMPAPALL